MLAELIVELSSVLSVTLASFCMSQRIFLDTWRTCTSCLIVFRVNSQVKWCCFEELPVLLTLSSNFCHLMAILWARGWCLKRWTVVSSVFHDRLTFVLRLKKGSWCQEKSLVYIFGLIISYIQLHAQLLWQVSRLRYWCRLVWMFVLLCLNWT